MDKDKEYFERNITLSAEFSRYLFEHPEMEDRIPANAQIIILPEDEPELCEYNKKVAEEQHEEGQPIIYVRISTVAPKVFSRLVNPRIEMAG